MLCIFYAILSRINRRHNEHIQVVYMQVIANIGSDIFFFPKLFLNSSTEFEIHKSLANSKLFQKKTTFWTFLQILTHCVMYCTSLSQCLWFHSQQNFVDSYEVTTTEATYLSNPAYLFVLSQRKFVERLLNLKI